MTKIICNRIDLIHVSNVIWLHENNIALKEGKSFLTISLTEPATFQSSRNNSDSGSTVTETITAKARLDVTLELIIRVSLKNYILKLYTDDRIFFSGSQDYPSELTYSSDKIFVNLNFKATLPLL